MPSAKEPSFAQDAESSMRAAARVVLEASASGKDKEAIVLELRAQGIVLPDPEDFVERILSASESRNSAENAVEPGGESPTRPAWFSGLAGAIAVVAVSWGVAFLLGGISGALAGPAGKLAGLAAGGGIAYLAKERGGDALFAGAAAGVLLYLLSAFVVTIGQL